MKFLFKLIVIFTILSITSCKTKYVTVEKEVPIETIKTEYKTKIQKDSIYIHDSIDRYVKGDTIYISSFKTKYKIINKIDTLLIEDSIQVPVYITKEVTNTVETNKMNWLQKTLMYIGIFFLVLTLINIIINVKWWK